MTTLKNSDRGEVVRRALAETFAPRFSALRGQVRALIQAKVEKEHPEFVKLAKSPKSRHYLAVTFVSTVYFVNGGNKHSMAEPVYGKQVEMPTLRYLQDDDYSKFRDGEVIVPLTFGDFEVSDSRVLNAYRSAWVDYAAACDKLYSLLYSYTVREKFTVDFPEFAKHLPPLTVKAKLPAVIVKDVRAQLSKLGIPAK